MSEPQIGWFGGCGPIASKAGPRGTKADNPDDPASKLVDSMTVELPMSFTAQLLTYADGSCDMWYADIATQGESAADCFRKMASQINAKARAIPCGVLLQDGERYAIVRIQKPTE